MSCNYDSTNTIYRKNSGWAGCPGGGAPDDLACPGRVPRAPKVATIVVLVLFPRASCSLRSWVPIPRSHAAALATPPSRRKASVHSELPWTSRTLDAWARGRFLLPTRAAPQTWRLMQACRPAPARALGPATAAITAYVAVPPPPAPAMPLDSAPLASRYASFSACVR